MNDVDGVFKEIDEDDLNDEKNENHLKYGDYSLYDFHKKKKGFSFLKWFKKNKNNPQLQTLSAESTPTFERKKKSDSCESLDTIFSTQTVRSFAYIPSNRYQPSAPPSELLEFNKYAEENNNSQSQEQQKELRRPESEIIYNRKKKRKAPSPPKLSRKNSLPIVLQPEKTNKEFEDCFKTCHRRTVSDSFKDKEKPVFRHVQGKRKAPQPPTKGNHNSDFKKVSNDYQSLGRKKKAAPPPPSDKKVDVKMRSQSTLETNIFPADKRKKDRNSETFDLSAQNNENDSKMWLKRKTETKNQTETAKSPKAGSSSPLASRPWYKRSTKSSHENSTVKGIEKRKSKRSDDWMPDGVFSMKNLLLDSNYGNKINIFSRLDKNDDKKKEEKRKSQISILTNISELDREAAEILKKEQAAERRMTEAKDARFYEPSLYPHLNGMRINEETLSENMEQGKNISELDNQKKRHDKKKHPQNTFLGKTYDNPIYIKKSEGNSSAVTETESLGAQTERGTDAESHKNTVSQSDIVGVQSNKTINSDQNFKNVEKEPSSSNSGKTLQSQEPKPPLGATSDEKVEKKEIDQLNGPWICKKCTLENPGWRVFCEICNSLKPYLFYNSEAKGEDEKLKGFNVKPPPQLPNETKEPEKSKSSSVPPAIVEPSVVVNKPEKEKIKNIYETKEKLQSQKSVEEENIKNDRSKINETAEDVLLKEKKDTKKPENSSENSEVISKEAQTSGLINKLELLKKEHQKARPKENVAEAYIITTTTILEDVIIKRGNKIPKETQNIKNTNAAVEKPKILDLPQKENNEYQHKMPEGERKNSISDKGKVNDNLNFTEDNLYSPNQDLEDLSNKLARAESLADYKANFANIPPGKNANVDQANRLLKKLEEAINNGEQSIAAGLSKELAHVIVLLKADRQRYAASTSGITVYMHVEDKVSHRGPFELQVLPHMTLLQLKKKVYKEFGFPTSVQRWILGKQLATDDNKTLESHGIKNNFCSLFLYLVAPDKSARASKTKSSELNIEIQSSSTAENGGNNHEKVSHSESDDNQLDHFSEEKKVEGPSSFKVNIAVGPSSSESEEKVLLEKDSRRREDSEKSSPPQGNKNASENNDDVLSENNVPLDLEKTKIKFIPRNSVKQKVEQINRISSNIRIGPPEKWKCLKCDFVNSSERLNCFNCKSRKLDATSTKPCVQQTNGIEEQLNKVPEKAEKREPEGHYKALIELEESDLVPNIEPFNCPICLADYSLGQGIILKNCLHTFCRPCLIDTVKYSEDAEVKCPFMDMSYSCTSVLQEREIKALVPKKIFEIHLSKSIKEAEHNIDNAFHCKTTDCKGWCIYEDNVNEFHCPVCKLTNCLTCQAIHTGINCREYQEKMTNASDTDVDAKKTKILLEEMVEKGEAMVCPKCQVVLMKKWGCDWLKCSMCKTEICWVTRGFRWGPAGKGDTSGGCKCGVKGIKCHPKCNYCH